MREVRKKYTLSDVAILSWRSREMSANMAKDRKKPRAASHNQSQSMGNTPTAHGKVLDVEETELGYVLPEDVNNGQVIPKTFFDNEGELNLSKVKGDVAVAYLRGIGLNIPTILR